ncbi:protein-tyrosine phosphatase-like protein [Rhodocollybia butyracea]|uniref:protein-tyrosine-phosphatase n=1 Tax=Rhodocollybia butyracea TaxID=206335 RepID=A0A9P5QAL0_9AGAR|nr:protein-tyrosine phosphatase-like protein [Rhodocollybia butyracea]
MNSWKNINAIIEGRLYLGNIVAARSTRTLVERRITHILSVCRDPIPAEVPTSRLVHMRIPVEDIDYADILIYLPSAVQFIEDALRNGGVVLVHCAEGLSRSATVIAAYLMHSRRVNATQALQMVRQCREQIWPNPGFQEQLVLYELCQYAPSPANGIYVSWKHKLTNRLAASGLI